MSYAIYHPALWSALNETVIYRINRDIQLFDTESVFKHFQFDGIPYGETKTGSFEIATIKGKNTKKWLHISIYRMDSGRYELTIYIL